MIAFAKDFAASLVATAITLAILGAITMAAVAVWHLTTSALAGFSTGVVLLALMDVLIDRLPEPRQ